MTRIRMFAVACIFASFCSPWVAGDDKPKAKAGNDSPAGRVRGQLPQNWGKLGLSDEQRQKIYKVRADYGNKIDALQKQISALRSAERKEMEKVLTDAQRARLREILAGRAPADRGK
jgi:Spy/CpxP family protein refolding chaperone